MKYVLAIVLVLIIATVYFIFGPEQTHEAGKHTADKMTEQQTASDQAAIGEQKPESPVADKRYVAMKTEYEKLEKARRDLERKLSRLKTILWNVELPADQATEISEKMKTGYGLLKNKKMLGAYFGLDQISIELGQIKFTYENLDAIEQQVRDMKAKDKNG